MTTRDHLRQAARDAIGARHTGRTLALAALDDMRRKLSPETLVHLIDELDVNERQADELGARIDRATDYVERVSLRGLDAQQAIAVRSQLLAILDGAKDDAPQAR